MRLINRVLLSLPLMVSSVAYAVPDVSVVFVHDESGSISTSNFALEKAGFISAVDDLFPLGGPYPNVELSAIKFASKRETIFDHVLITDDASREAVRDRLANNRQLGGSTYLNLGTILATDILDKSTATKSKVICLATDGRPASPALSREKADIAKSKGYTIVPIGIGAADENHLNEIASNPPATIVSTFSDFGEAVKNDCIGDVRVALTDSDGDGLWDEWENDGFYNFTNSDGEFVKIELPNSDPFKKNLYYSVYVTPEWGVGFASTGFSRIVTAINSVISKFDEYDIILNVEYIAVESVEGARLYDEYSDATLFGNRSQDCAFTGVQFGDCIIRTEWNKWLDRNHSYEKRPAWRSILYAPSSVYSDNYPASGVGIMPGSDVIVSVTPATSNDYLAITTMHEIGHNLGLGHGGIRENSNGEIEPVSDNRS